MIVLGLDGQEYRWKLRGHGVQRDEVRPRSSYHLAARELLRSLFPADAILEEVPLPGCPEKLFADFVLPLRRVAIEVQGEQHYTFISHFHRDKLGWLRSRNRDLHNCTLRDFISYQNSQKRPHERLIIREASNSGQRR